ncbi:hypothetical protein IGI04_041505, partial [Brassica rapa subsp. trilocularis]
TTVLNARTITPKFFQVGKTYLFKIGIERENYVYKHDTFNVMKVVTNQNLIEEFGVLGSA